MKARVRQARASLEKWRQVRAFNVMIADGDFVQIHDQNAILGPRRLPHSAVRFRGTVEDHQHAIVPLRARTYDGAIVELIRKFPKASVSAASFLVCCRVVGEDVVSFTASSTSEGVSVGVARFAKPTKRPKPRSLRAAMETVLDDHAHESIGPFPTMLAAMRAVAKWKPKKIVKCDCGPVTP